MEHRHPGGRRAWSVRFAEVERAISGISRRMLALKLEWDGLLVRTVHTGVLPRAEYTVTEMAQELPNSLLELTD
ncbi:winged helix-turn-helix transcriptional regulator [Spirillospora sp. CA-108201]